MKRNLKEKGRKKRERKRKIIYSGKKQRDKKQTMKQNLMKTHHAMEVHPRNKDTYVLNVRNFMTRKKLKESGLSVKYSLVGIMLHVLG